MQIQKILILCGLLFTFQYGFSKEQTIVEKHGQLRIEGTHIVGEHGKPVQLRGMSLFWSQWQGKYYNAATVKWLVKDWGATIIRPAMGVEKGGYLVNPEEELFKVETVIKAAIKQGIYVLIDYHAHEAHKDPEAAERFFTKIAKKYGKYPNVIYETYNEPLDNAWSTVLKPYHERIIAAIRKHDPDNIIVCGTKSWSQRVDEPANDPIDDANVAYTLHYYAFTHRQSLRDIAQIAIDKGLCLFVTEFGVCHANGNGKVDEAEARIWWDFLDKHKISWCNWSISDKDESASAIPPGASEYGKWPVESLTESGKMVREEMKTKNAAEE